jgi:tetraacyldisaccharide 4'-kinase
MSLALAPLGLLYGAAVRTRLGLYRSGLLKSETIGVPVISVGNITAGGTGKTPLVEWVARAVSREGLKVCVLTRGYGRADESKRVVASDGVRVLAEFEECGDEPRLLAERLVGAAAVVCDRDRVAAARWALENLGADVFVLDDGFQHLRIARGLDIVTVDASAPWGGGHLLPRGRLREPREGLARADCVVITRSDMAEDLGALRAEVLRLSRDKAAVVTSRVRTLGLSPLDSTAGVSKVALEGEGGKALLESDSGKALLEGVASQPVGAFCAIGNPRAFFAQLRRDGFDLRHERAFADHHAFTQAELGEVVRAAGREGARALLTTAKDAVKLRTLALSIPSYVVETGLEFDDEGKLLGLVREAVRRD